MESKPVLPPLASWTSRRRLFRWSTGGGMAAAGALLAGNSASPRAAAQEGDEALVGAWVLQVANADGNEETDLIAFLPGGVYVSVGTPDGGEVGVWAATGGRGYAVTLRGLGFEDGQYAGMARIQASGTLDESLNVFSGSFRGNAVTPGGEVVARFEGEFRATRITLEPP